MALSFINRDARQMIRYGHDAKEIVDQMQNNLRIVEGVLDSCRPHLDDNANRKIDKLHEFCDNFRREIAAYRAVAETVEKKGKDLLRAQELGG